MSEPTQDTPFKPIGVGFLLLALPLLVSIAFADSNSGRIANGVAGGVLLVLGALMLWPKR